MEQDDRERVWRAKFTDAQVRTATQHMQKGCQTLLTLHAGDVDAGSLHLLRMYSRQIEEQLEHLEVSDEEDDDNKGDLMDKTRAAYSRYLS